MEETKQNFYLTSTPIKKLLLKFSIPCILGMLVGSLYNIVDQVFIGNSNAGTSGIMATTLAYPFTVVALAICLLIGDGCASLYSISLGSKDEKTSKKCIGNAIIALVVLSILLMALGLIFMTPILKFLGAYGYDNQCQQFTTTYFKIILIGIPFNMFSIAMSSIIRASGAPTYSMLTTVIGAIINIILDPILIFGFDMGVTGAAIATIVGQIISALVAIIYFLKPKKLVKLSKESFKIDWLVLTKMMKLGVSSFVTQISISIVSIVANNVVGSVAGSQEIATDAGGALGIVFKVFGIVISFNVGTAVGGQPIIGYNYGAKKFKRVLETYRRIIIANIIIGLVAMVMFEFFPEVIVNIFGGHANDVEFYRNFAVLSFRIYLGGILLCCVQKASCIFLQSIDRPVPSMILSVMRDVIFLVPGICLLGFLGGLENMLWAGLIADIGAFILTVILVAREYKKIAKLSKQFEGEELAVAESNYKEEAKINHFVISIGREFGSGGKYIGQELAKRLNVKCYDEELLEMVSKDYNIDIKTLEEVDEKQKQSYWYSFASNYVFSKDGNVQPISAEDNLFLKQAKVIEDIYHQESSVIIGRCSDFILKDKPNMIAVFIYSSDMDFKLDRKKDLEKISVKAARKKIEKIDKERSEYYHHFTSQIWGDKANYDICIDTSKLGIENTINILEQYIKNRIANYEVV